MRQAININNLFKKINFNLQRYREILQSHLQNSTYQQRSYQHWMNEWYSTPEKRQVTENKIQQYSQSNFISRWWQRRTTDISVRIEISPIWNTWNYAGPVQGLANNINTVRKSSSWFSTLRWRLTFMSNGQNSFSNLFKRVGSFISNCFTTARLERVELAQKPTPIAAPKPALAAPAPAAVTEKSSIDVKATAPAPVDDIKIDPQTALVVITPTFTLQPAPKKVTDVAEKAPAVEKLYVVTQDIAAEAKLLGITEKYFSQKELTKAYRNIAKTQHPDKTGNGQDAMKELNTARAVLDQTIRTEIDAKNDVREFFLQHPKLVDLAKDLDQQESELHAKRWANRLTTRQQQVEYEANRQKQKIEDERSKIFLEQLHEISTLYCAACNRYISLMQKLQINENDPDLKKRQTVKDSHYPEYLEIKAEMHTLAKRREDLEISHGTGASTPSVNYVANQMLLNGKPAAPAVQSCAAQATSCDDKTAAPRMMVH